MSESSIRAALELHLAAIADPMPTVYQNKTPSASFDATRPHQKAYLLPATNQSFGLSEKTTLHRGIFQVSLCYPTGNGTIAVEARGKAIQAHFYAGRVLEHNGVKVRIRGKPSIAAAVSLSPYVVPVSIRYESIF